MALEQTYEPSATLTQEEVATALRRGLRSLAKAVVVITCRRGEQRYAMAATAVSELSMDPPSMLICVNKTASLYAPLAAGADFCINILRSTHADISMQCGGRAKGEERFVLGTWRETALGAPYLEEAQASFACRNVQSMGHGTHAVYIGEVVEVFDGAPIDPLVYVDGRYTRVRAD